jgi:hypothetical protein
VTRSDIPSAIKQPTSSSQRPLVGFSLIESPALTARLDGFCSRLLEEREHFVS